MSRLTFLVAHVFLGLLCVLCYYNSLRNEFAFDDYLAIVNNPDVMYGSNGTHPHHEEYFKLWKNDIWGKSLLEVDSHRSYRPLLATLFKFLVHCTGGLNPTNFRIVSVALHCVATLWVAQLARHTFGSNTLGMSTAMLFASHPVHVEAVAAVVNLAEAASLIFYIFAYFVYKHATTTQRINPTRGGMFQYVFMFGWQLLQIILWLCLLTVSVLLKETGITLCGVVVASSIIQLLSSVRTNCFLAIHRTADNKTRSTWFARGMSVIQSWTTRHLFWVMACFYAMLLYFVFRTALIAPEGSFLSHLSVLLSIDPQRWQQFHSNVGKAYLGESQLIRKAENPFSFLQGEERLWSMMYLHFRYFYQLLWPVELCAEYAFDCIPTVSSSTDPRAHYALFFYAMLLMSVLIGIYRLFIPSTLEWKTYTRATVDISTSTSTPINTDDRINKSDTSSHTNATEQSPVESPKLAPILHLPLHDIVITPEAFLQCMVWLVVPFVPASGLLLKLGTLLAERLLYAPSVGYCMLLTLVIHTICHRVARMVCMYFVTPEVEYASRQRQRHHRIVMIRLSLYWICIVIITAVYTYKTISHNLHWYNDETLHMHDWTICPRSAKLNTQIAKIHMNKGDLTAARFYLNNAMNIDPDFCDTGHQHALLLLFHEHDMDGALNTLADNLKCIYTNKQSFEVLHKLWDEQLSTPGAATNHQLLASHAKLALRGGLTPAAGKKFQAASILAFQAQHWEAALSYSIQAEETIALMLMDAEGMNGAVQSTTTTGSSSGTMMLQALMAKHYPREENEEECVVTDTTVTCTPTGHNAHLTNSSGNSQEQMRSFLLSFPRRAWIQPEERAEGASLLEMYGRTLTVSSTEHSVALVDLACNIYLSGARLREHMQHQLDLDHEDDRTNHKMKKNNKNKKTVYRLSTQQVMELKRVEELFYYAAQSHCVIILEDRIVADYASQALTALSESLMTRTQGGSGSHRIQEYVLQVHHEEDDENEEEQYDLVMAAYAQFSETSSKVLQRLYYKYDNPTKNKNTKMEMDPLLQGYANTKDTAITLWDAVGHALYRKGAYLGAAEAFKSSIAAQWDHHQQQPQQPQNICMSVSQLLWFANVLAANQDTFVPMNHVTYAAVALDLIVSECNDQTSNTMLLNIRKQATKQFHALLAFVNETMIVSSSSSGSSE